MHICISYFRVKMVSGDYIFFIRVSPLRGEVIRRNPAKYIRLIDNHLSAVFLAQFPCQKQVS